ncbi:menaquinol-cytochrome c reductase cytochrome b subunit precursor [Quadrisphaera granulorum]|uniref:Cytochrome bc1 complex cytochrome b subunit n=1 Tax=Quadrisphaera granulorum TaxID=317664 RepID=A0A315ZWF2_9ACTN|nr:cytochrome bc complex cytochrome b subunit [Quadrisphaera granulorum]PWJ49875.1 menaquinol-cytochrome c reductase cytochrome b subunit precursor [Quadrisphaera granulorum]SZE98083.1 menaquinol-cytochrome c reductase cytochrome b subunit precursor [Quadrisphaera granulorum]
MSSILTDKRTATLAGYVDDRVGASKIVKTFARKIFPDHWSFMLGEVCLYTFVVLLISGTFLTFWYTPSMALTTYEGSYPALVGQTVSEAYATTLHISFDIRGGLLIRQIHHWAALLFVAAILAHMARIFVTGAFRKPRELNWVVGCVLAILALAAGFTGYSLPDDLLSGNGLRIISGVIQAIPVVGTYMAFFIFGGEFPGEVIIPRLFIMHVMLIPAALLAMIGIHLGMLVMHKHMQFPGPGRTNNNVVGYPVLPVYAAKAGGFFFIVFGVVVLMAATVTINPIWNYGPYDPSPIGAGTQPDWYILFVDGALRLMPGWLGPVPTEFSTFGYVWSLNILLPGAVVPGIMIMGLFAYPWIEQWLTGDTREHHLLDRPRNKPTRTGLGVAALVFYVVMALAATNDLVATHFHISINDMTYVLRTLFFVGPPIAFWVTKRICLGLQRRDRELALHGRESGRIVRTADGEYFEVHEPLDVYERWNLVQHEDEVVVPLPQGRATTLDKLRARLSAFFFEDRIAPVTPAELEAAHAHGGHGEVESGHDVPAVGATGHGTGSSHGH